MKARLSMEKGKASSRGSNQQSASELKNRVILALNKLSDRDTYQIAVQELDRTIQSLNPDGVAPFLSCILDTGPEQKITVRKECVRLMASLVIVHEGFVRPHIGKMMTSIVKRLKDSDSVMRESCVDTVGILASKLSGGRIEKTDGIFVELVRPLFEALGERNKQVQYGSAFCLSRIIDNVHDPPPLVLQNMLLRTVKLLRSPHFVAKPAVIELNRSIILAGGALTHSSLAAALTSIQESLKNVDWATRKAACVALGDIASCGVACIGSFRDSCIRCLDLYRFDKIKPVRDEAVKSLLLWGNLPTSEPSEAGSSAKETSYRSNYGDITSNSDSTLKDIALMESGREFAAKRVSLSSRSKRGKTHIDKSLQSGSDDWKIEIAIPNRHNMSSGENRNDESEDSDVPDDASLAKSTDDVNSIEEKRYTGKMHDRRSLDSTVTESTPLIIQGYSQTEKDMVLIKNQLLEIESRQSSMMDMLQALSMSVVDSMSKLHLKVSNLELAIDKMAQEPVCREMYSESKRSPRRLSACNSRTSVDDNSRQTPLLPTKNKFAREDHTLTMSGISNFRKQNSNLWTDVSPRHSRCSIKDSLRNSCQEIQARKLETTNIPWKTVKDCLNNGDLESAYEEALCSRSELLLFDLLDRTGPVLEYLSKKTAVNLLSILASYLLVQQFVNSIVPWLHQLVDICNIHGPNYLVLSSRTKRDFLSAILESAKPDVYNPSERKFFIELGRKLRQIWG